MGPGLQAPARELVVGLDSRMPAALAADGSETPVALMFLENPAEQGSGAIRLDHFVVEAVGKVESLGDASLCVKPHGRLFVFGMPHYEPQEFPWYTVFRNNVQINTCVGPECGVFFPQAMEMILDERCSMLRDMVQPILPWDKAVEGFDTYLACSQGSTEVEDSIKLILEL